MHLISVRDRFAQGIIRRLHWVDTRDMLADGLKRYPRAKAHNIIDARWVITWKRIEGNVGVKCRLAVRGVKD